MGIEVGEPTLQPARMVERARQISQELREGLGELLPACGIEIVAGQARLVGPKTVEVMNGQKIQADRAIVVATGAGWAAPPDGIDPAAITTPHQAMNLNPIPAHVLIWGGGPVELEFATLYACLGSKVSLVIDGAYPMPAEDYDIGQRLQGALREQGIQIFTNATLKAAVKSGSNEVKTIIASRKGETELTVSQLLWAGRRPHTTGLGLAEVGVKLDAAGAITVNPYQQTSVPSIYAVGDVVGQPFYSSIATLEGLVAAENIMGRPRQLDRRLILRFAFTIPEVGCVGLTEEQAEDAGYEVEVINLALDTNSRATGLNETAGGIKIVANKKQGKILGVHIIGHRATELVAEAAMAVQLEAIAEDWAWAIRVHPTLSESMVEAGRAVMKQALYIPPL
jgi:dihydrolipoamide dehydrogenase